MLRKRPQNFSRTFSQQVPSHPTASSSGCAVSSIIFKSISSIAAYQSSYTKCSLICSRGGWDHVHVMLQVELKQFRIDQFIGLPELDAVGLSRMTRYLLIEGTTEILLSLA